MKKQFLYKNFTFNFILLPKTNGIDFLVFDTNHASEQDVIICSGHNESIDITELVQFMEDKAIEYVREHEDRMCASKEISFNTFQFAHLDVEEYDKYVKLLK